VFNIKRNNNRLVVNIIFTIKKVNIITQEEYIKANFVVESLIDKVDDSTPNDSEIMKKFLAASDIVEAYEEIHFLI
jgi:hypothetical protein